MLCEAVTFDNIQTLTLISPAIWQSLTLISPGIGFAKNL